MADVVDKETRSRMMSGIRGVHTKPEMIIRRGLHQRGFRFRLHEKHLPGKPDIVLPKHRAAVLVQGCFWHGHDCPLFRWPGTRQEWWREKIEANRTRDRRISAALKDLGWRQAYVWECALKGRLRQDPDIMLDHLADWIRGQQPELVIRGTGND